MFRSQQKFLQRVVDYAHFSFCSVSLAFPGGPDSKESAHNVGDLGSIPGSGRFPGEKKWQPTPGFLPGKSHGQRGLADYSPWGLQRVGHN